MRRGNEQKRRRGVGNIAIWLAAVLFCLVVVTTYLSAGLFARYVTRDDGGDDARVITFGKLTVAENDVVGSTGQEYIFIPGVNLTKKVTVSFGGSESDTFVFVALEAKGWESADGRDFALQDKDDKNILSWSVDEKWTYLTEKEIREGDKVTGTQYVYYLLLDANTPLSQQVIENDTITVSAATNATYEALKGETLHLNVTATAVQANGFYNTDDMAANAIAAWNSVNK